MRSGPESSMPWWRREAAVVAGLLACALAVRVAIQARTPLIGADSARFLRTAYRLAGGRFREALSDPYHPLYPALVAAAYRAMGMPGDGPSAQARPAPSPPLPPGAVEPDFPRDPRTLEGVATAVNIAVGTALVGLLYGLTRTLLGRRTAAIAGLIAAGHPHLARLSADIMSDTVHLAAYTASLWLLWLGLSRPRRALLAAAGLATGLAYLARPEGLALSLCAIGGILLRRAPGRRLGWKLSAWAAFLLPCAALALPYAAHVSAGKGGIFLTGKKFLPEFYWMGHLIAPAEGASRPDAGIGPADPRDPGPADPRHAGPASGARGNGRPKVHAPHDPPAPRGPARRLPAWLVNLGWIGFKFHSTLPEALFAGFVLALLLRRRIRAPAGSVLLFATAAAVHVALLERLLAFVGTYHYLSRRHVLTLVVAAFPWSAAGLEAGAAWIASLRIRGIPRAGTLPVVVAALVFAGYLPKALKPQRLDQLAQRRAGRWLRERYGPRGLLYTTREKIAYYAGYTLVPLAGGNFREVLEAPAPGPRFIAFYAKRVDEIVPGLRAYLARHAGRAPPLRTFRERNGRALQVRAWR